MTNVPNDHPKTRAMLLECFPRDLVGLIIKYFASTRRAWLDVGAMGEYETCLAVPDENVILALRGACYEVHREIVNLLLPRNANDWGYVLCSAAYGNMMDVVSEAITHDPDMWSWAIRSAVENGHDEMTKFLAMHVPEKWNDRCFYETGIAYALHAGREELALWLIDRDPHEKDYSYYMHDACYGNCRKVVDLAISKGATNWNGGLWNASCEGHYALAKFMIAKGATNWNAGLRGAAGRGGMDFVELMISYGANDWNGGLSHACRGGHLEIAKLMISRGANDWNEGLSHACRGGYLEIAKLMISRGANNWDECLSAACTGGHMRLVKLMISHGANNWDEGYTSAKMYRHKEIADLMIANGYSHSLECEGYCAGVCKPGAIPYKQPHWWRRALAQN